MSQMIDKNQIIKKREDGSINVITLNTEKTLTQQQFRDECDINKIIKSYEQTGAFTHVTSKVGQYADFSNIKSYHEMVDQVLYAQEAFMTLPAPVRARFRNDPGELLQFIQDPSNRDEAATLGLIEKPEPTIRETPTQPPQTQTQQPKP